MANITVYKTLDNGGDAFTISFSGTFEYFVVTVQQKINVNDNEGNDNENNIFNRTFIATEMFIGKSPFNSMTEFSGGHGDSFDGNSILINVGEYEYIHIGASIFSFKTDSKVVSYVSPVGNSGVPYPYAILENGDIYLMIENVILMSTETLVEFMSNSLNDPYDYYYCNNLITPNLGIVRSESEMKKYLTEFSYFKNIRKFTIGGEQYTMRYCVDPKKEYQRLKTFENMENTKETEIAIFVSEDLIKCVLTCDEYCQIMHEFGEFHKFKGFESIEICERL